MAQTLIAQEELVPAKPAESSEPSVPDPGERKGEGITAMEALRRVTEKFGRKALVQIADMHGSGGQSQPMVWKIAALDLSSPFLLKTFRVDPSREVDEGQNRAFYPDKPPAGFISVAALKLGSYDAFLSLDKAAAKAKVGFDSVDYRLRCREFTSEPIWTLTAVDSDGFAVGILDISGTSGKVLRTVWLRRAGARGLPTIEDSVLDKALRK